MNHVNTANKSMLERRIYFFRADIRQNQELKPWDCKPSEIIRKINSLPFTHDYGGSRYQRDEDGNDLCILTHVPDYEVLRFCRVRRTGLPQLEQKGHIQALNIAPEAGLLEAIHVVFFPYNNILGIEYNHYGPRISRLVPYLVERQAISSNAIFRPLLQGDVAAQLDRLTEIRFLDFSIHPLYTDRIKQADRSLGDAFDAANQVLDDPDTIQLILKSRRSSRKSNLDKLLETLKKIVSRQDLREYAQRLQVRGQCADTGRVETIDLLRDQLVTTKKIVCMDRRSRALDPDSAFCAIREAYHEKEGDLRNALAISP